MDRTRLLWTAAGAFALVLGAGFSVGCGGGGGGSTLAVRDLDSDGVPDDRDNDLDGDGRLNQYDLDIDGDSIPNWSDPDIDEDGVFNLQDDSPYGPWYPSPSTVFVTQGQTTLNFGDVPVGQTAGPGDVTIQNDSLVSLTCTRVAVTGTGGGTYTLTSLPGGSFALGAGGARTFGVIYKPKKSGPNLGRIEIDLRDGGNTFTVYVNLLGMGSAPAMTTDGENSAINFGDVPVGVVAGPANGVIDNGSGTPYTVTRVQLTGTGGGRFFLDTSDLPSIPFVLQASDQAVFRVTYAPNQGVPNIGRVEVDVTNGTSSRTLNLDLFGQGIAPSLTVDPNPIDVGTAISGFETSRIPVVLRNEFFATGNLNVTALSFPDDMDGELALESNPAPFTLAPGQETTVIVLFSPAAGEFGPRDGSFRVEGNDPNGDVDQLVAVLGRGAGWEQPTPAMPSDLTFPSPDGALPVRLAGTTLAVLRAAGPNGVFAGVTADDQIVVVDADPDADPTTSDGRVVVRWQGFRLPTTPSGRPVDAGDGVHVYFVDTGVDGLLGTADDQIRVLDVVGGPPTHALAAPNLGQRKSRPVVVDGTTHRVVVAAGIAGGSDTLLVYENLLGDTGAIGPTNTVALGVAVPDVTGSTPVVFSTTTVLMPAADADGVSDPTDRRLDDADEGIVQVRGLGTSPATTVVDLNRALCPVDDPLDGDVFCTPVVVSSSAVLVATEGASAASTTDDEVVRLDDVGTASIAVGASVVTQNLSGVASRPVRFSGATWALASPGADDAYGTSDDRLARVSSSGAMSTATFGPGGALGGGGGHGTVLLAFGLGVVVPTHGANGVQGGGDDALLHVDPLVSGAGSVLGTLRMPGGLVDASRSTPASVAAATALDARFVIAADRGNDGGDGTGDEVFRVFRDRDGDGRLGDADDDLDADGVFGASDAVVIPAGKVVGDQTPVLPMGSGHFLTLEPGADGAFGTGGDDHVTFWWLQESATLP